MDWLDSVFRDINCNEKDKETFGEKVPIVRWIKKTENLRIEAQSSQLFELYEMYWFIEKKSWAETRGNTYIITLTVEGIMRAFGIT